MLPAFRFDLPCSPACFRWGRCLQPLRVSASVAQVGLAQMLKGGVIMDVTNVEEARVAEEAGAVAVMALERVPADIRRDGGVARMRCAHRRHAMQGRLI